jgi:hypothetical protein
MAKYPKPSSDLERLLLLNWKVFNGNVDVPIAEHEAGLMEVCGTCEKGNAFSHHYELLKQWRSWRAACARIDQDARLADLAAESDAAKTAADAALLAFIRTPTVSLDDLIQKLHQLRGFMSEDKYHRQYSPLWSIIDELKAAVKKRRREPLRQGIG